LTGHAAPSGNERWQVQVAGHLCVDLQPELSGPAELTPGQLAQVGPLRVQLGGCVGNTGMDLAALGIRSLLVACVGGDDLAGIVTALIAARAQAGHRIALASGMSTSYSVVVQPPGLDRTFWHHVGANAAFGPEVVDPSAAPVLHLGYLPLLPRLIDQDGESLMRLLRSAAAASVTTSIDMCVVDPRAQSVDWSALLTRVLPLCDIVSPSLDDMRTALAVPNLGAAEAADWLLERGPAVVMVTDGPRDLVLRTADRARFAGAPPRPPAVLAALPDSWFDRRLRISPRATPVVETTGAGDAATAALLAAVCSAWSLGDAIDLVLAAATHRVAGGGPLRGIIPSRKTSVSDGGGR
jgi:sugar/nucleoside kinase (ribokinase family)